MIPDLGPQAAYIWASYAAVTVVLAGLIAWLLITGHRLERKLADFEARGLKRRSAPDTSKG